MCKATCCFYYCYIDDVTNLLLSLHIHNPLYSAEVTNLLPSLHIQSPLYSVLCNIRCRVHKPGVPRGPASTPGLGPRKQHVVHGPAQESKTQRAGRTVRSLTGRSTQKNKRPLVSFFGPPLRPEHSLQAPAVSKQSLQSEGLAQNVASCSDPTTRARGKPAHRSSPTGALRADWSHPTGGSPFGRNQKTCGERQEAARNSHTASRSICRYRRPSFLKKISRPPVHI